MKTVWIKKEKKMGNEGFSKGKIMIEANTKIVGNFIWGGGRRLRKAKRVF